MPRVVRWLVLGMLWALAPRALAQTSTSNDAKVQPPQLKGPERASLVGQLASVAFGPADVTRGAFSLPGPFVVPTERGAPLVSPFPSYAPDAGMSEWGAGWQARLAITRMRVQGDLDFLALSSTGDELESPFGRLQRGADGSWFPLGLSGHVRVREEGNALVAYLPDGTRQTFVGAARVTLAGTYAWYLTEALSVTGRKTRFEWTPNASGRPFLTRVWYGGAGEDFQYRVDLMHEVLPRSFDDLRSGELRTLDRRVRTVTALVKHTGTGAFEERWRFELGYAEDASGPGFYLAGVQQVFRSGARPPAISYAYNLSQAKLAASRLTAAPKLDAVLAVAADLVQPSRSSVLDDDDDGMPDLEWAQDNRLLRQTEVGFASEPIQAAPGAFAGCLRPAAATNVPRVLSRLRSGAGDDATYVVAMAWDGNGTTTLRACNRAGAVVGSTRMSQDWTLRPTVRLADLNRDNRPDLVRVAYGQYRILPNTSTNSSFAFGAAISGTLTPAFTPDTVWVHDFNGDGIPDLIARYSGGLVVWYGKGSYGFVSQGRAFALRTLSGGALTSLSSYALSFVDANKDGLTDVLLTATPGNTTLLFMNRGTQFQAVTVPGLAAVTSAMSQPVVLDAQGGGNTAVTFTQARQGFTVELDGPETGLMASADDGRGTLLRFEYGRATPSRGGKQRQAVLSRLSVESSGRGPISYAYAYGAPRLHSVGRFLIGFDQVTRTDPLVTERSTLLNEDRFAGLLLSSVTHDANAPAADAFQSRDYEDALFQGIPWKRLTRERTGFLDPSGAVSVATEYGYASDQEFCPETMVRTTSSGVLRTTRSYVLPAAFGDALPCLWDTSIERGTHPADHSLDFTHETVLTRNAVGLVEKVESVSGTERLVLQTATYRPDWLLQSISSPGRGTSTFAYDPGTLVLTSVTTPEGVVVETLARDPLHDGILTLQSTRGTASFQQHFRFDDQERLQSAWDSLGASTELNPVTRFGYRFATAAAPAAIFRTELVDGAQASARDAVDLLTAGGEPVATASRIPQGWAFGPIATRSRATAETRRWLRPSLGPAANPMALDFTALLSGASPVDSEIETAHGHPRESRTTYHAGVERIVTRALALSGGLVQLAATENGTFSTTTWMDADRRVLAQDDEAGVRYAFTYDALGRLREIALPDGRRHRTRYDGHGRVWRIERDGVASVEYAFDPVTGLTSTRKVFTHGQAQPANALVRTVSLGYDAIGRVTTERHSLAAGGPSKVFTTYYDGATPAAPAARTTLGLLTGTSGDGYAKSLEYRADGLLTRRVLSLGGWRTVETTFDYLESGTTGSRTVRVSDGLGALLSTSTRTYEFDGSGRLSVVKLNGTPLARLGYDANGLLSGAVFSNGDTLTLSRDTLTRRPTGSSQVTASTSASTTLALDARGLVGAETFTIGATHLARAYGYSAQRFLTSAGDPGSPTGYAYGFDRFGLPTSITNGGASRAIVESDVSLTAGTVTYAFDGLHRTVSRSDTASPAKTLTLTYGADGQIATATRGGVTCSYVHDEAGQRLSKRCASTPTAAYLDEGFLDASGLTERLQIGDRTVGLIRNGVFASLATDLRGSVLAETTGTALVASPFGQRAVHPAMAAAIDYVEKGWDADLGLVRMGVRDYDPEINRFTTADPLYLEKPELCLKEPVSCNLYAYARGAPTVYVDPNGEDIWEVIGGAGDAVRSNTVMGLGRTEHGSADFRLGQKIGDALSVIQGGVEFLAGLSGGAGGALVTSTGVLAPAGVGAMVASAAVATHGTGVFATGVRNLFRDPDGGSGGGDGGHTAKTGAQEPKALGRGSTADPSRGTTLPRNLREELAVREAMSNPQAGEALALKMTDKRWPASDGWVKMQQMVQAGGSDGPINVHYVFNRTTGAIDDFKIVIPGPR